MSTVVRWNPFREMVTMQNTMDRVFDDVRRNSRSGPTSRALLLDVQETNEAYHIVANLPGVDDEQINVNLHDNVLTISAEIEQETVEEDARVLLRERSYGQVNRSVNLPQPVSNDDVEATYEDGILRLTLPKVPELQPQSITVKRLANSN
jgi:HSP20 family protein